MKLERFIDLPPKQPLEPSKYFEQLFKIPTHTYNVTYLVQLAKEHNADPSNMRLYAEKDCLKVILEKPKSDSVYQADLIEYSKRLITYKQEMIEYLAKYSLWLKVQLVTVEKCKADLSRCK